MKTTLTLLFLSILALNTTTTFAEDKIEVKLDVVLAPKEGFDDNDSIEVVLHGDLANACYTLNETAVDTDEKNRMIRIKQFASRRTDGICASDDSLPPHMRMLIPFTKQLDLGKLAAGNYTISYDAVGGVKGARALNVEHTSVATVDSFSYAIITGVQTADFYGPNDSVEFTVQGMFNTTCVKFDEERTKVVKEGDVFIVLPITYADENVACAEMVVPFKRTFVVGKAALGHHLIHVRSLNGQSANQVIEVLPTK